MLTDNSDRQLRVNSKLSVDLANFGPARASPLERGPQASTGGTSPESEDLIGDRASRAVNTTSVEPLENEGMGPEELYSSPLI